MYSKFEWEIICVDSGQGENGQHDNLTWRAKVFGGWLVKHDMISTFSSPKDSTYYHKNDYDTKFSTTSTMTFVPDLKHEWII